MTWRIYTWRGPLQALTLAPAEARDAPSTDLPPTTPNGWLTKQRQHEGSFHPEEVETFLRDQGVPRDSHWGCVVDNIRNRSPMMFSRTDGGDCVVIGVVPVFAPLTG